ncbi:GNAT family N-acetyltransferase [Oceanobacillus kapialis]|uniref:GNAT family N-acetyltransferase n=1 Tax=Oceanobacillus kapialis TaxID=481353 RepID=UPI00384D2AD9
MNFNFQVMTQEEAEHIAYKWHYDGEYAFYDMEADQEDLEEFIDCKTRGDSIFSVKNGEELVAFFAVEKDDDTTINISLGLRPDLTGQGIGNAFLEAGLRFVQTKHHPEKITLSVATFNQRAIKAYRNVGFKDRETFMQETNGSTYEFLRMEYFAEKI